MPSRVWLITGASSGFGLAMTRCALAHGDRVLATLRSPTALASLTSQYPDTQLVVVPLDVTRPDDIKATFQRAKSAFGRIDVVFNNAGIIVLGESETTPDDPARKMFEVNFWGAAHVSQEAVRFFREENVPQGGHLVQHLAAGALMGFPALGFYVATKHALLGLTETLRLEMNPAWNIKFTAVETGRFKTSLASSCTTLPQDSAYADPTLVTSVMRKALSSPSESQDGSDPARGVEKIYALTTLPDPPLHFPLGNDAVEWINDFRRELAKDVDAYAPWSEDLTA